MLKTWRMMVCAMAVAGALGGRAVGQELLGNTVTTKDIVYAKTADGGELKLDLYLPAGGDAGNKKALPVILRVSSHEEAPLAPAGQLLSKGYALVYAAYLPANAKDGTVFTHFPSDEFAVKAAIRWVRGEAEKRGFDADQIGLWASDDGATLAALAAVTPDQKDLNGTLGDHADVSSAVKAVCLFGGTTDWRNAELYGDETVNIPGSPAYQLFGGNPKEFPEDSRKASAVNYVRPTSPATLMVTLASDSNRAMHLIFAETLRRAGVASAMYEEAPGTGAGAGGRAVDEARLSKTIVAFFNDTLPAKSENTTPPSTQATTEASTQADTQPAMTLEKEIQRLIKAGLFKQARRLIEEQVTLAANSKEREPWLKMIRQLANQQQEPALRRLAEVIKANATQRANGPVEADATSRTQWTIREVLTDPDHIGEYQVEATVSAQVFDMRAAALMAGQQINELVAKKDWTGADQRAANLQTMAASGIADLAASNEILARYLEVKRHPERVWPIGIRPVGFASDFGQDLYGNWFEIKAGGVPVRFRYVPAGSYLMGSNPEEWGRLPGEKISELTDIRDGFWIEETLVPQSLWEGVLGTAENHSHFKGGNLPAENLSYAHAVNFIDKLGVSARLPTQVEWEYACRAGSATPYAGTGRLTDMAWFWDEKREGSAAAEIRILHELETDQTNMARSTHDVKTKMPNRWGVYDMQGEVWEWCSGTSAERPSNYHVTRGGSWISIPQDCRAAREAWFPTEQESWNIGMRMVIPAQRQQQ